MKRLRLVMLGVLALVLVPSVVLGQQSTKTKSTSMTRCERFDAAVDERAVAIMQKQTNHSLTASRIEARVTGLTGRLDIRGLNSDKLKADLVELEHRTALLNRDYDDLVASVRSAKGACAAQGSLQPAREKLDILSSDMRDLQTWLRSILRPDILAIKIEGEK
jgi:hypothetical protein